MYLKYIQIVNFRNIKSAKFEFSKGANTIIGENDAGKSNALTAIRILLDNDYFYTTKLLKESDFSDALEDWRGHWIIISALFDEIDDEEGKHEGISEMIPDENQEKINSLKSYIRCKDKNYGTVTLFIRPRINIRRKLFEAAKTGNFSDVRSAIKLEDYEFYYTSRSQLDFTKEQRYRDIVGDVGAGEYANPEEENTAGLGIKVDMIDVWQHISTVYIDALRDVTYELRKSKNPLRLILGTVGNNIAEADINDVKGKILDLNEKLSNIPQISDVGSRVNQKLLDMVGAVYSPEIKMESRLKDDLATILRYLTIAPLEQKNLDLLGLGHLNILYIAMKLVEFDVNRQIYGLLNIMMVEEPEAHIHTHIQKTLFKNLEKSNNYTQVLMTTHSTHLSEVANIEKVNVMEKVDDKVSIVMKPSKGLNDFGKGILKQSGPNFTTILSRYLDAKRSVLLFSKGVILVEGDGEEILIPSLVKKVLGIALEEIGIGLINVGSVAFENIACIFDEQRLRRNCAIITDLDTYVKGSKYSTEEAMKRGLTRREKLLSLFWDNPYVEAFYAPHTLEVEFSREKENREFIYKIIKESYTKQEVIERHINAISSGTEAERYISTMIVANHVQKGWYATLLAEEINSAAIIPNYILDALAFAAKDTITEKIIWKMVRYAFNETEEHSKEELNKFNTANSREAVRDCIIQFCSDYEDDMVSILIKKLGELNAERFGIYTR